MGAGGGAALAGSKGKTQRLVANLSAHNGEVNTNLPVAAAAHLWLQQACELIHLIESHNYVPARGGGGGLHSQQVSPKQRDKKSKLPVIHRGRRWWPDSRTRSTKQGAPFDKSCTHHPWEVAVEACSR